MESGYIKPGEKIWLYLRRYEDGTIKYFVSNAPEDTSIEELDRAATLRWPIEQCFEECKSYLGMSHYESQSYEGWMRHMQFVMIAHLFTTQIKELMKKGCPIDHANGGKVKAGTNYACSCEYERAGLLSYKKESLCLHLPS